MTLTCQNKKKASKFVFYSTNFSKQDQRNAWLVAKSLLFLIPLRINVALNNLIRAFPEKNVQVINNDTYSLFRLLVDN